MKETIVRGRITLPRTAPRGVRGCYAKLLYSVDREAKSGFGFEGKIYRPGQALTSAELRPEPRYPALPVVLEMSLGASSGISGRRRRDAVYTLWRWSADAGGWLQLGQVASASWEWAIELRPLAVRALTEARGGVEIDGAANLPVIAGKISAFLDGQFRNLTPPERDRLLAVLHDEIAARICAGSV